MRSAGSPAERDGPSLTIAWAERPRSLDPALANDHTALNVVAALGDPLVRLDADLEPVGELASSWETSRAGTRVTFHLRLDGRWTNGEPVTASDFAYSWRRALAPALRSPHAALLYGIRGAKAYNRCAGAECPRLARAVGIDAPNEGTLVVTLTAPRPWFVSEVAHPVFLPVHRRTVERHGDRWTEPRRIVTSGPFALASLGPDSFTLVRSPRWRGADDVALARVQGRVIPDARTRVQAFDAGQVQALDGSSLPGAEMPALRERREYEVYPALASYGFAFNLASVTDVRQRRAMALAVDREALAGNVLGRDVAPATAFMPPPAAAREEQEPSDWLPPEGDLEGARAELDRASRVRRSLTVLHVDEPGEADVAGAAASAWRELGLEVTLRSRPANRYLDFAGPLSRESADLYAVKQRLRVPEPIGSLAVWECRSAQNKTNFCRSSFDRLLESARAEQGADERGRLYGRAEEALSGETGAMPGIPLYWDVFPNLEALSVRDSFRIDPLGRIDLTEVEEP